MTNNISRRSLTFFKRTLALLVAFTTMIGIMPGVDLTMKAKADWVKTVAGLGTGAISKPVEPKSKWDEWEGSYVYYGKYDTDNDPATSAEPVKYRVLDPHSNDFGVEGGSLLLDCDSVLYDAKFDEDGNANGGASKANEWAYSDVKTGLNGALFLDKDGVFSDLEKSAIEGSTKSESVPEDGDGAYDIDEYAALSGDKVFFLDDKEATRASYGYFPWNNKASHYNEARNRVKKKGNNNSWWWLRSPYADDYEDYVDSVVNNGMIGWRSFNNGLDTSGVSPVFNVRLSSIIFSSLITGTAENSGAEYKLTLLDNNMTIAKNSSGGIITKENTEGVTKVTIPYTITGLGRGNATQVSVVITDKDGAWSNGTGWINGTNLLQYSKLTPVGDFSETGKGTFVLNDDLAGKTWGEDYHVYLLAEDVNGDKETDYASNPVEIPAISYNLWVGATEVTNKNCDDILAAYPFGAGKASYNSETKVLYFNDFSYEYGEGSDLGNYSGGQDSLIYKKKSDGDEHLTIDGKASLSDNRRVNGIHFNNGTVTLKGSIKFRDFKTGVYAQSIVTEGDLEISSGITYAYIRGIDASKTVSIVSGSVKITVPDGESTRPVRSQNNGITVADSMTTWKPDGLTLDGNKMYFLNGDSSKANYVEISEPIHHMVFFNLNGEKASQPPSQKIMHGEKATRPELALSSDEYEFNWFTDKDCTNTYDFDAAVHDDLTLYAKLERITLTVNFNMKGHGTAPAPQAVNYGEKAMEPAAPSAEGFIFTGWYSDSDCTTKYDFTTPVTADKTLYAGWREIPKYTVTFDMNGKIGATDVPEAQTVESGKKAAKPAKDPQCTGFTFAGWYKEKECTTAFSFDETITANTTVYAKWIADGTDTFTITFNLNEKTGTAPDKQTVEKGGKASKPATDPTSKGFKFLGWYEDKECTKMFDFNAAITADMIVYAKWVADDVETCTVTFDLNKKIGTAPDKQTVEKGGKASKPADPKVEGFTFTGWFTDADCKSAYDFSTPVTASITLYAGWKETAAGDDPTDPVEPEKKDPRKTPVTPAPVIKESTINGKTVKIEADITYPQAVTWTGSTITREQLAVLDEKDGAIAKVDISGLFDAIPALKSGIVPSKLVKVSYTVVGKTITDSSTKAYFTVSVKLDKKAVKRAKIKGNDKKALQALVKDLNDQIKDVKYYFEIIPIQLEDASSVTVKAAFDKKKYVKTNEDNTLKKVKSVKITVKIPSGKNGKTKNKSYTYKKAKDLKLFRITVTDMANKKKATADISATDTNTRFNGTKTGITVKP